MEGEHIFYLNDYKSINKSLEALLLSETNPIANMANASSLLWHSLSQINWVGFYLFDRENDNLVLGPFQGKPACVRINPNRGVCGAAYTNNQIMRIADVHNFPEHIACDSDSMSEIVLPIVCSGIVIGVLDIDSPKINRFTQYDETGLIEFIKILINKTDYSIY